MTQLEFEQLVTAARFSSDAQKKLEAFAEADPEAFAMLSGHQAHSGDEYVEKGDDLFHGLSEYYKTK